MLPLCRQGSLFVDKIIAMETYTTGWTVTTSGCTALHAGLAHLVKFYQYPSIFIGNMQSTSGFRLQLKRMLAIFSFKKYISWHKNKILIASSSIIMEDNADEIIPRSLCMEMMKVKIDRPLGLYRPRRYRLWFEDSRQRVTTARLLLVVCLIIYTILSINRNYS